LFLSNRAATHFPHGKEKWNLCIQQGLGVNAKTFFSLAVVAVVVAVVVVSICLW
jgi:hypothetical protein